MLCGFVSKISSQVAYVGGTEKFNIVKVIQQLVKKNQTYIVTYICMYACVYMQAWSTDTIKEIVQVGCALA